MSKKSSSKKGTAVSLTEFTGDKNAGVSEATEQNSLDDFQDTLRDEIRQRNREKLLAASKDGKNQLYNRKAGSMGNFRSALEMRPTAALPTDMPGPFVAHLGNLPHGITEEKLCETFSHFSVVGVCVVATERATFGFVEVSTRNYLQALILEHGRHIGTRPISIDVANEQQLDRQLARKEKEAAAAARGRRTSDGSGSNLSRDDLMGQAQPEPEPQPKGKGELTRDDLMGQAQPEPEPQPKGKGELTRDDLMGHAQPEPEGESGGKGKIEDLRGSSQIVPPTATAGLPKEKASVAPPGRRKTGDDAKPVFKTSLGDALDDGPGLGEQQPVGGEADSGGGGWSGFDLKSDPEIRRQAQSRWADILSSTPLASTEFPAFPSETLSEREEELMQGGNDEEAEKQRQEQLRRLGLGDLPASPPSTTVAATSEAKASGEGGEQQQGTATTAGGAPGGDVVTSSYKHAPYANYVLDRSKIPESPQDSPAHQVTTTGDTQTQPPAFPGQQPERLHIHVPLDVPPPRSYQQQHNQNQQVAATFQGTPPPEQQPHRLEEHQPPSNHELQGHLPFFQFDNFAKEGDLPTHDQLGLQQHPLDPHPKLFIGHLWSRCPTGVVQWLLDQFTPKFEDEATGASFSSAAFDPQLHFGQDGNFRGCLHVKVATVVPSMQVITQALHRRILFDREGVWFAQDEYQMGILAEHCRMLHRLSQAERREKIQNLPHNALVCEVAENAFRDGRPQT